MPTIGHAHKPSAKGLVLLNLHSRNVQLAVKNQTYGHCDQHYHIISPRSQEGKNDKKMVNFWLDTGML